MEAFNNDSVQKKDRHFVGALLLFYTYFAHIKFFQQELRTMETKDTKGVYFVVADDLRGGASLKNETNRRTVFPILRHLQLTREIRGPGSIVRFAVV